MPQNNSRPFPAYYAKQQPPPNPIKKNANGDWGPPEGHRFYVSTGWSWDRLAKMDGWSDPKEFVYWQMKTRNPLEINWYLRELVGCDGGFDGVNYSFRTGLKPGFVYTRNNFQKNDMPYDYKPGTEVKDSGGWSGTVYPPDPLWYFGVGAKVGGMWGENGAEKLYYAASSDYAVFAGSAYTQRSGWGSGFSGAVVLAIFGGIRHPYQVEGLKSSGPDFTVALGPSKLFELAAEVRKIPGIASLARSIIHQAATGERAANVLTQLRNIVQVTLFGGTPVALGPKSLMIDLPIGGGFEASAYWGDTTYSLFWNKIHSEGGTGEIIVD
jgi:hypothetical protein